MTGDIEIMSKGINCLLEKLGVVETEKFIAVINREKEVMRKEDGKLG